MTSLRASAQDGTYPRPLLLREEWTSLDGTWRFAYDDADAGRRERWHSDSAAAVFERDIVVPFVPESAASGIGDTAFHPVVWYRREFPATPGAGRRVLLHVGAVDDTADVWVDETHVGSHRGGQTSFTIDITDALREGATHSLVIRAEDDPTQSEYPRGKQDWMPRPHDIWYERSTGIWRSVWIEEVPDTHIVGSTWTYDPVHGRVEFSVELNRAPLESTALRISLRFGDETLGELTAPASGDLVRGTIDLPTLRNAQHREKYLWSPENPRLLDVSLALMTATGTSIDEAATYCGLRTVGVDRGRFLLNDRPYYVRSVLEQGYWPESHLTAPSVAAYRDEVELIRDLGFNAVRVHQKTEDPRFHYWADRLGLLVWGETAAPYAYSDRGAAALAAEWSEIVRQYRGHPSIVTWVPVNESWGVQDLAHSPQQRSFVAALTALTRALDPDRPVVSNDGWEHVDSDILTVHDYTTDAESLAANWGDDTRTDELIRTMAPNGRRLLLTPDAAPAHAPLMVSEFGGISYATDDTWGYTTVDNAEDYERLVGDLFRALRSSSRLAGFCYTQLTDTLQEANGLLHADRTPKLPLETLRRFIAG
jgi:beta-galactosidase/beta-glucuronidase